LVFLYFLALFCIIFVPGGVFRVEQIFFALIFIIGLFKGRLERLDSVKSEILTMGLMALWAGTSLLLSSIQSSEFIWRDFLILPKLLYFMLIVASGSMLKISALQVKRFSLLVVLISVLLVIISIFQYFNVFSLNRIFIDLYRPGYTSWLTDMTSSKRIIGTMGNPNYWGLVLSFFTLILVYFVIYKKRLSYVPLIVGLLMSIIFSGSRTAAIITLVGAAFGTMIIYIKSKRLPSKGMLLVLSFIAILSVYYVLHSYYQDSRRFKPENTQSLEARYHYWLYVKSSEGFNILIGQGPSKGSTQKWVDNSYLQTVREYGLPGLILYLMLLSRIFIKTYARIRDGTDHNLSPVFMFLFISWLLFEFVADGWDFLRSASLFLALYSICYISSLTPEPLVQEHS
jgi:hypothetical protein